MSYMSGTPGASTISGLTLVTNYVITHGLPFTPSIVLIQPTSSNATAASYITNKTSTTFTVNFNTIPILGTNNISFDWIAFR